MKAEVIYIGTELLLGQILNSNAVYLGCELAALGIDCHFQTIVGDNKERIKESFGIALQRADLIITTGGLGPTSDDLTTECWAEFFEEEMFFDAVVFEEIKQKFSKNNKPMAESNRKQALRPKSAAVLPNPSGSAPGITWDVKALCKQKNIFTTNEPKLVLTFPGVPRELDSMWQSTAKDFLASQLNGNSKLFWKELKFFGIGESALAERVQDLLDLNDPTVAPLAGNNECRLRMATKATNQEEADLKLEKVENEIKSRVGEFIYGCNDDTLESVVADLLKKKKQTLAVAESCTGGLLSERLTSVAGSSNYIKLNVTTYSNQSKEVLLSVHPETLSSHGAVSEQTALEMAEGMKKLAGSDWTISITGIAGPDGGSDEKPIGTVYIALIGNNYQRVRLFQLGKRKRQDIRSISCQEALNWLRQVLIEPSK